MKVLGITGGIGSGKSIVSKILETMGVSIYNTDIVAKNISNSSKIIRRKLSERFGATIYKGNTLDRIMFTSLIFSQPKHLAFVNSVIHPEVLLDFLEWKRRQIEKPFVGIETAILFESGFDKWVDISINIFAPTKIRIQRVQEREKLCKETTLNRIIYSQLSDKDRICRADYTIINDDNQAMLPQIENLLAMLQTC